eukprot:1925623-Prymnesium_polylepis.1
MPAVGTYSFRRAQDAAMHHAMHTGAPSYLGIGHRRGARGRAESAVRLCPDCNGMLRITTPKRTLRVE